jgi:glutamate-5-semialdehyde dehydrogenase
MAVETTAPSVSDLCRAAKAAARSLAATDSATRDGALLAMAAALEARTDEILEANARDLEAGRESGLSAALMDRLALDEGRIAAMAAGVRAIVALPDPVGEVIDGHRLGNGLDVRKVRVPLGVVAVVYEGRPNVTIDAAALCLKSGNAVLLRGSSSAAHSNAVLAAVAREAVEAAGLAPGVLSLVAGGGRDELAELAGQEGLVDLIIPRGGEGLKKALSAVAKVPVIYAASGNCHVYVDASADLDMAERIVVNAKVQRPGVCNAAETLLVHEAAAEAFVPRAVRALRSHGVELRAEPRARAAAGAEGAALADATEEDFAEEFLALIMAVKVVGSVDEAIEHVNAYGSGHSEAIVTADFAAARSFQTSVDAACVYVNASTRFTDGGEFGMGAEIGNSTQKLHARGPIGLRELCTFKYLVDGTGQVRG